MNSKFCSECYPWCDKYFLEKVDVLKRVVLPLLKVLVTLKNLAFSFKTTNSIMFDSIVSSGNRIVLVFTEINSLCFVYKIS